MKKGAVPKNELDALSKKEKRLFVFWRSRDTQSTTVKIEYQGKGTGWRVLQEINRLAKKRQFNTITLECFKPLIKAIALYEKSGFRKTWRITYIYGIRIFDMIRRVRA